MSADALAQHGLQSGVVLAVVLAAVIFSNHLGGSETLAKRLAQVALGLVLVAAALAATNAITAASEFYDAVGNALTEETAQRVSEIGTLQAGIGISLVIVGVLFGRTLRVITPAVLLAGILLLLFGLPHGAQVTLLGLVNAIVAGSVGDAGTGHSIARVVMLLVGALSLAAAMYWRWERSPGDAASSRSD